MNAVIADRELEAKHRALWALGDYGAIAARIVAPLARSWLRPPVSVPPTVCWTWPRAPATSRSRQRPPARA